MCRGRSSDITFVILGIVIVSVTVFFDQDVSADGKHFPEKAYKQAPAIPHQRAILTYRDGIEKLTIESSLDGQGREFGWVIPLPSKPTEFEKTSPGLIKTFSLVLQPRIVHDLTRNLHALLWGAVFVTLACLIIMFAKSSLERIGLLVMLIVIFGFVLMPSLGRVKMAASTSTDVPGIKVHDIRHVGSYELAVLEAENSLVLDTWLGDNGFAGLTQEDEKIVSDYINDNWCFVAAKLRRDGDGYSRPHPLSMSFPYDKPIYPVRLTATVDSNVYLELFVIADKQASCDVLTLEVSDEYRFREERKAPYSARIIPSDFAGKTYKQNIGHSDAAEFMWDGCSLSKLCGSLEPKDMRYDIVLRLTDDSPRQERYYSHRGAREAALVLLLRMWCVLLVALTLARFVKKKQLSSGRLFVKRALAPTLLLSLLGCVVAYAVLPKIEVRTIGGGKGGRMRIKLEEHLRKTEIAMLARDHDDFVGMGKDEIASLVDDYFKSKNSTNVYSGEPLRHEDSPGDYTIIEDDRGIVWRTYSMNGSPVDHIVRASRED